MANTTEVHTDLSDVDHPHADPIYGKLFRVTPTLSRNTSSLYILTSFQGLYAAEPG